MKINWRKEAVALNKAVVRNPSQAVKIRNKIIKMVQNAINDAGTLKRIVKAGFDVEVTRVALNKLNHCT